MDESTKANRFASELERMLDGERWVAGDEDQASLLELAGRLRREAPAGEPDPAFVDRLRGELIEREGASVVVPLEAARRDEGQRRDRRPAWWRVGAAGAALVAVAAIAWLAAGIPGVGGPGGDSPRLPSLLSVAAAYAEQIGEDTLDNGSPMIGDAVFWLSTSLPTTPSAAPVYRQQPEPIDEAGARDLASRLGINVDTVSDDRDYGVLVVTGEGGRLIISQAFRGYFSFESVNEASLSAVPSVYPATASSGASVTPAPDEAESERTASEFLRSRGLLDYENVAKVESDAPPGATPLYRKVTFTPTIEGRPVRGLGAAVTVGPEGRVTAVQSAFAPLTPGQSYPIITAEDAYKSLTEKRVVGLQAQTRDASGASAGGFSARLMTATRSDAAQPEANAPAYRVGDAVELEGLLSAVAYEAKDGSRRYQAWLLAGPKESPSREQYRLSGSVLAELAALDQLHVRVRGTVQALADNPSGGRLAVTSYEKLYPQEQLVVLLGRLEFEGDGDETRLTLVTDEGRKYRLESRVVPYDRREYQGRRVVVEGRTTERTSDEGYPIIEPAGMQSGSDIDAMKDLATYEVERPQVIPEREPMMQGDVTISTAALEYYAIPAADVQSIRATSDLEPFLLVQPIYSFAGTFDEGRGSFEAQVPAVRPEYVQDLK